MSSKQNNKSQDQNTEKLKEIPKWTRKYAQNRTLTILVLTVLAMLFGIFVAFLVSLPLALAFAEFRKGNIILGCVGIAVLIAVLAALVKFNIFMFAKYGGKNKGLLDQIIDRWIYGKEGTASMPASKSTSKQWLEFVSGVIILICSIGSMYLAMEGYIASKYLQPVMAIYFVPFLVFQYFLQKPRLGPLLLLCPILYAIHAILIVASVPIFFTGNFAVPLNIFIPFFGYTFLAYIIAHIYSRHALKKLKGLTHLEGDTANGD